jgi:REP element-mobilizing transposase RayT
MATYHITRRTMMRTMLLRPDGLMTRILVYLLAAITRRHGIEVHAFCAMSDHIHLVITDVRGTLPKFLQAFHLNVARCTQVLRSWNLAVWDKTPTSVVRLETEAAIVEAIAYVLANPVNAGLVRRAHEWPGAKTLVSQIGQGMLQARRPDVYLKPKNWPEEATLTIALPPGIEPSRAQAFRLQIDAELAHLEAHAHAEMARQGRRFLGAWRAAAVPPTDRATTPELAIDRNPRFAVGHGQGDAYRRAVAALRAFHASYRTALDRWRAGLRDAVFPPGTWWMCVFHRAVVSNADTLMAA